LDDDLKKEIRKIALQNAVEHDGKTKDKVVLSKSLGTIPELKNNVKDVIPEIASIVSQINGMSIEEQKTEIQNNFPEILDVKENVKEERVGLPPLEGAENGKVVTRFIVPKAVTEGSIFNRFKSWFGYDQEEYEEEE